METALAIGRGRALRKAIRTSILKSLRRGGFEFYGRCVLKIGFFHGLGQKRFSPETFGIARRMKIPLVAAGLCLAATISLAEPASTPVAAHSFIPDSGFVPDETTAIRIAVAVWYPIYGEKQIQKEQPYKAKLKDGVWEVTGSLPGLTLGGTAIAEISKKDGTILRVSHGQ